MDRYFMTIDHARKAARLHVTQRALAVLAAVAALFALAGDRGVRSATNTGADPLELLNLQAKANAFIILDTSGSMGETQGSVNSNRPASDDYTLGKLHVAKSVLANIITANQTSVAFSFGTYSQGTTTLANSTTRFLYATTATASPGMVTSQIIANSGGSGGTMPVGRTTGASDTFVESGDTRYLLHADRFVNGVTYKVYTNGNVCSATTGTATSPPTVTLVKVNSTTSCTAATLSTATFTFAGAEDQQWSLANDNASCTGYQNRVALAPCSQTDQLNAGGIGTFLNPALLMNGTTIAGYAENASGSITSQPTVNGLRAAGYTPIANTLLDFKAIWDTLWTGTISSQTTKQSSFAIVLTDGDDTCASRTAGGSATDNNALRAAYDAQVLYAAHNDNTVGGPSRFKTFVVFLGTSTSRANWIAWGGTGMTHATSGSGEATMWNAAPTAAQRTACTTCVDAFTATTTDQLTAALQAAINLGQTGNFSDRAVIASVYEDGPAPLDPTTRYSTAVPVLFQSSWVVPDFQGHLMAFANVSTGGTSCAPGLANCQWDAGTLLLARVTITPSGGLAGVTFAQLHGGATDANIGSSSAMIKRRIYTTTGNGSNGNYTAANLVSQANQSAMRVALWPPAAGVDPASGAGTFDTQLGLPTDLATLQSQFGACMGTPLPSACSGGGQLAQATKEAREMVLAYMAGAQVVLTSGAPTRDTSGNVLYAARSWILADSTGAAPAVADPPPNLTAALHAPEWTMFLNGPTLGGNGVAAGLGLKQPDAPSTASDLNLKPVMTVVYLPANDMLHAFRAGACPGGGCTGEKGGQELWGFVPYDQLGKLTTRLLTPQTRANHTYMMAAPVRLAHVFVPGHWSATFAGSESGTGVWRTVLLAGRGPGGKSLTALDVTVPGPTTIASLSTTPPIVMWSRGKGDGIDSAYAHMGETWSVPAVGPVDPTANGGAEFVAYVGSGYTDVAADGTTFYAINVLNGSVIASYDVDSGDGLSNSLVASPSLFQSNVLAFSNVIPLAATDKGTFVYFPDVHGRIYRFDTSHPGTAPVQLKDYTTAQPFGVAMMLLNVDDAGGNNRKPHVYAAAGDDSRVAATNAFEMVGLRDDNGTNPFELFALPFPSGFRGTVEPVGVYDATGNSIALFVGTKYTPATTQCVSSFDSVLYIVQAGNGQGAYDLPDNGGRSIDIPGQKVTDLGMAGGRARLAGGLHPDEPIPPPTERGTRQGTPSVSIGPPVNMPALAGTTSFKLGTNVVCR